MRIPLGWLADYVDLDLSIDELAYRMTMGGLKVETIERIGEDWQDVVIGHVVKIEPHPRSNKPLHVAIVDIGDRTITLVTGAQNVYEGARVPVVLVGGLLPHGPDGEPMIIQAKPMAGITSEGMLASERELGISDEHSGIYVLPSDAPVGAPLRSILGDDVLEIETNANRPDTLSVIGVARDVAAMTEQQVTAADLDAITGDVEWIDEDGIEIEVEAPELCPRYSALRIEGVAHGSSPLWLTNRLEAAGQRSISLLVDLTNYVMLEYGQPMHAFDARSLRGDAIVVRRARPGETLRTLDGVERILSPENLVIADRKGAVGIAGVMGGENSEIAPDTTAIVLESATFDRISVRRTAQDLRLRTEASARFEKGLPPEQTVLGLKRFLQLLAQITGGPLRVYRIVDRHRDSPPPRVIELAASEVTRLLGIAVPSERIAEILSLLGFDVSVEGEVVTATVPFWRRADIEQPADLVEEVARMMGYDAIPSTLLSQTLPPAAPDPALFWEGVVRDRLVAAGANEAVTHSLTSPALMARLFAPGTNGHGPGSGESWTKIVPNPSGVEARGAATRPVQLANFASTDRQVLRLTLVPSLLDVAARNLKHTEDRIEFFEVARTFFDRPGDLPYQRRTLAVVLSGNRRPHNWRDPAPGPHTFYDIKGMVATVLDGMDIRDWKVRPAAHPALHPGRSAVLEAGGADAGHLGELHPEVAAAFDLDPWRVQVAEIDLDVLLPTASDIRTYQPVGRYPSVRRDIAVVVDEQIPAIDIVQLVRETAGPLLENIDIFDVYAGPPLPDGKKSVAVAMQFRSPESTLTQEEVTPILQRIVSVLGERLGATLRE